MIDRPTGEVWIAFAPHYPQAFVRPTRREAIRAVLRGPNSCGKWATCAVAPCACADAAAAAAVAAFLRAMPHHQMKRRTGIKPARYSIEATSTAKLAAAVERAAQEAGDDR